MFMLDITGSMNPYIKATIDQIKKFIETLRSSSYEEIKTKYPDNINKVEFIFEVAIVAYRDFDDIKHFEVQDFTTDIDIIEKFLSNIKVSGGNDIPEDVEGAFIHALFGINEKSQKLSFDTHGKVTSRIMIWMADAPPHGIEFSKNRLIDNHNYKTIDEWGHIFDEMKTLNIELYITKLNEEINTSIDVLQKMNENRIKITVIDISQYMKVEKDIYGEAVCIDSVGAYKSVSDATMRSISVCSDRLMSTY
jgi:hypothetical protein